MRRPVRIPGLPDETLGEAALEEQEVSVTLAKRTYGKMVTVVEGFDLRTVDVRELSSRLKSLVASGGTGKGDRIELQGDHRERLKAELERMGFRVVVP